MRAFFIVHKIHLPSTAYILPRRREEGQGLATKPAREKALPLTGRGRKEVSGVKIIIEADSKEIAALVSELQERRRWELFESPVIYRGLSEQGVAGVFGLSKITGSKGSLIENHGGGAG